MTDYREIIRLHSLKFSNVSIANSLCCSRNTVSEVLKLAETHSLEWPIPETLSNKDIEYLFYPNRGNNEGRRLPDYEYVYNELAKPGVTLSLLWAEYCAKCEAEHTIPYQHSQFNDKYHAYAASKKATLRIKRKPGETMEVDWVGDTLKVYDAASCYDIPACICALGIAACRNFIKVRYVRLPDLLNELAVAHGDGTLKKVIKAYQKIDLLILDEFLLSPVSTEQTRELLEIIEARSVKGSVIFCTQFEPKGWYSRIGNDCDATICEAIIDRIIHNSYEVMLDGRISMRERHGIHASRKGAAND